MPGAAAAVEISDIRKRGRVLRLSWHVSRRAVVVSQWRDGVCVASTPIELADVPDVVNLLVQALSEGAKTGATPTAPTVASLRADIGSIARSWLRPHLASIVALSPNRPHGHVERRASGD